MSSWLPPNWTRHSMTLTLSASRAHWPKRPRPPGNLYQRTPDLESYFAGNPDAWFARDGYGPWLAQLREMGVRDTVAVHARSPDSHGHVVIVEEFARHERGLHG